MLLAALFYLKTMKWSLIPQKPNKVPYIDWAPYQKRLPTEEEIKEWFMSWPKAMIGIVTGSISGITVVDIDTKEGRDFVENLLPEGFKTPMVRTPRDGRHLYFSYDKRLVTRTQDLPGIDTKNDGGLVTAPPSVHESGKEYKWIEALSIRRTPLARIPEKYVNAVSKHQETRYPLAVGNRDVAFTKGQRDETLFHAAYTLIKGGMVPENVEKILLHLAQGCDPPFPEKEAIIKVRSAVERAFKQERNLAHEIKEWVGVTSGVFCVTDIYLALHLVTTEDKSNARQVLRRLKEDGIIEVYGKKSDVYRRLNPEYIEMPYKEAVIKPLDIDWPLDIGQYVYIYAKNLIVFAGTKDSGKTTLMLDVIKRNQAKWDTHYFSSEMGNEELSMRLQKHTDIKLHDWKFSAYEKTDYFADVIKPDAFNVIDYIEINKDFSEIGDQLKAIHQRLDKGIALIGIQKKWDEIWGRGGQFTSQRPRLYITLESRGKDIGVATIRVAKNRKGEFNPVGLSRKYRMIDGWKIVADEDWGYGEEEEAY